MDGLATIVEVEDPKILGGLFSDGPSLVVRLNGHEPISIPWGNNGPQTGKLISSLRDVIPNGLSHHEAYLLACGIYTAGSHPSTASRVYREVVDPSELQADNTRPAQVGHALAQMYVEDLVFHADVSALD